MSAPIERIFLGWDTPALASAATHLVNHYRVEEEARLDRAVVVLPGGRAGRRLLELLLDEAETSGVRLVPPRIGTIGKLPELLYRPELPLADSVLARRVWAMTLAALDRDLVAEIFPHPPEPTDIRSWSILGRQVERIYRELSGAGIGFDDVARQCREDRIMDNPERWSALGHAAQAYLDRLAALGFTDRERARQRAVETGSISIGEDLWLLGIVDMPTIVHEMISSLDSPVRALVHAPEELGHAFDELGCVIPEEWTAAEVPVRDDQLWMTDRPADQAEAVVQAIADLRGSFSAEEVTIGVPDPELVPYLEEYCSSAGLPTRYATGTALDRTGPYRLLDAVAAYLDGRRFPEFAALVRHPDLWLWLRRYHEPDEMAEELGLDLDPLYRSPDSYLGAVDRYSTENLPAHLNSGPAGSGPDRDEVARLVSALDHDSLLGSLTGKRRLAEWAPAILQLLVEVYGAEPLDRSRPAERRLLEACEAIRKAAIGFYQLPEILDEPCLAADAIRLILAEADGSFLAPDGDQAAIELLGWLELHLDDAPALVITGANEPRLPESVTADAFLPNSARTRLGLLDNELRYARDAYQLTAILNSRPEVRVLTGRHDGSGDPLRPSRLLFATTGQTVARRVHAFFGGAGHDQPEPAPGTDSVSSFQLPPEPIITATQPLDSFRITDFRALIADPYRFALERLVRLDSLDDEARELDPLRFGSLAHKILEQFGRGDRRTETDPYRLARHLDDLLDTEVSSTFGKNALPAVRVQIEQLRARLHAFARWQTRWAKAGWQIEAVELSTDMRGQPFDVDGEPVYLRGRIDRIDRNLETGEWAIFDYKTGDKAQAPERTHRAGRGDNKYWVDLQLPLYLHLLPGLSDVTGSPIIPPEAANQVSLGYILLPRDLDSVGASMAEWGPLEIEEAMETAREVIRSLRDNGFAFHFDPERMRSRRGDPLAALLGVGQLSAAFSDDEVTNDG